MTDIITYATKVSNSEFGKAIYKAGSGINYLGRVIAYIPIVSMPIGFVRIASSIVNIIAAPIYAKIENNQIPHDSFVSHNKSFQEFGKFTEQEQLAIIIKEYRTNYLKDLGFGVLELTNLKLAFRLCQAVAACFSYCSRCGVNEDVLI